MKKKKLEKLNIMMAIINIVIIVKKIVIVHVIILDPFLIDVKYFHFLVKDVTNVGIIKIVFMYVVVIDMWMNMKELKLIIHQKFKNLSEKNR